MKTGVSIVGIISTKWRRFVREPIRPRSTHVSPQIPAARIRVPIARTGFDTETHGKIDKRPPDATRQAEPCIETALRPWVCDWGRQPALQVWSCSNWIGNRQRRPYKRGPVARIYSVEMPFVRVRSRHATRHETVVRSVILNGRVGVPFSASSAGGRSVVAMGTAKARSRLICASSHQPQITFLRPRRQDREPVPLRDRPSVTQPSNR